MSAAGTDVPCELPDRPRPERVLYAVRGHGPTHDHALKIVEVEFADGREIYVDVEEPRGCTCARRIALSELAHLLLNVTEGELLTIPNRDLDAAGHAHVVAAPSAED